MYEGYMQQLQTRISDVLQYRYKMRFFLTGTEPRRCAD